MHEVMSDVPHRASRYCIFPVEVNIKLVTKVNEESFDGVTGAQRDISFCVSRHIFLEFFLSVKNKGTARMVLVVTVSLFVGILGVLWSFSLPDKAVD